MEPVRASGRTRKERKQTSSTCDKKERQARRTVYRKRQILEGIHRKLGGKR